MKPKYLSLWKSALQKIILAHLSKKTKMWYIIFFFDARRRSFKYKGTQPMQTAPLGRVLKGSIISQFVPIECYRFIWVEMLTRASCKTRGGTSNYDMTE